MRRREQVMPGLGCDPPPGGAGSPLIRAEVWTTSLYRGPHGSKDKWAHRASVFPIWDTRRPEVHAFKIATTVPLPPCPKARLRCSVRESGEASRGPVWLWVPCT